MQEEIDRLQTSFTEDLATDAVDSDMADQLAMQSSLAVLAERMATIHMKASGKQQLLEVFFAKIISNSRNSCFINKSNFISRIPTWKVVIITQIGCGILQERVSDCLEGQLQEQAVQLYHTQADELDQWLGKMRSAVMSLLEPKLAEEPDIENQLAECQVRVPPAVHPQ